MKTQSTKDLIHALYESNNKSKKEITKALYFIFNFLLKTVLKKQRFHIVGFGEFNLKQRKPKTTRHPKTKKITLIPQRQTLTCTFSQSLRQQFPESETL